VTLLGATVALALAAAPAAPPAAGGGGEHPKKEVRCGACHSAEGWDRVTFDHARTGFPLDGAHRGAPCRGCHAGSDFKKAVPRACVACHRDVHAGRLGTRCQDCHDAVAWKEPTFGPEEHRRSDFPLDGRHAVLPCTECHGDVRDRSFSRPTRRCFDCHDADLLRATASGVDHAGFGAAPDCRTCHGAWSFSPGYLPGHDVCFPIRAGRHSGIACMRCHTSLPASLTISGCNSSTFDCRRCHSCAAYAGGHGDVGGYSSQCNSADSCYNCHPNGVGGD
jgi:hypothetical protein